MVTPSFILQLTDLMDWMVTPSFILQLTDLMDWMVTPSFILQLADNVLDGDAFFHITAT